LSYSNNVDVARNSAVPKKVSIGDKRGSMTGRLLEKRRRKKET
jgi:hypothetical protein